MPNTSRSLSRTGSYTAPDAIPPAIPYADLYARLALLLLTLLALALRLYRLDAQSLWYDEGVSAQIAMRSFAELIAWTARDIQPPLYYAVVSLWGKLLALLGTPTHAWGEWSLRFPSAFCGALTVPLIGALARGVTGRRAAAVLAALLAALHPLLLYYSQEARMYALLVALCVLLGWLAVRCASGGAPSRPQHWVAYVLVATAAIYTHYFAAFLIAALALVMLIWPAFAQKKIEPADERGRTQTRNGNRLNIRAHLRSSAAKIIGAHLAVLLLYLPWIAVLFFQLRTDASYWQGDLKLDEALVEIGVLFTAGETVHEYAAVEFFPVSGALTLLALLGFALPGQSVARRGRTLLLALLWTLLPTAAVLGLALTVPKFNGRYVMVALPGLLLLWAAGLGAWFEYWVRPGRWLPREVAVAPAVAALLMLGIFVHADRNWFVEPAFTKAQWRELAEFVRAQKTADEAVLLVSGHAWPVWDYYAPDLPAARIPPLEILDVNAVLDYRRSAELLQDALADSTSAWVVGWQDEVIDPMAAVPLHLTQSGSAVPVAREFWQLHLQHFAEVDAAAISPEVPGAADAPINFGGAVQLLGHTTLADGELLLFWRLHPDYPLPSPDFRFQLRTWTDDNLPYWSAIDRRLADFEYPTFRWRPSDIAVMRLPVTRWAGPDAIPDRYTLRLTVYDADGDPAGLDVLAESGQPLGKVAELHVPLSQPTTTNVAHTPREATVLQPELAVQGQLLPAEAEPGRPVQLTLTWTVRSAPTQAYELHVAWSHPERTVARETVARETLSLHEAFPTDRWQPGQSLRTVHRLLVPPELLPGAHTLAVGVTEAGTALEIPFHVLESTRVFVPPPLDEPVESRFGEQIALLGLVEALPERAGAGDTLNATLVWRALDAVPGGRIAADYTVTLQLLDDSGAPRAQTDVALPDGSSNWGPGQVLQQPLSLDTPNEPGAYRVIVALYDGSAAGFPRLSVDGAGDFVELGVVRVE